MKAVLTSDQLLELFKYLDATLVDAKPGVGQVVCDCSETFRLTRMFGRTHNVEASLMAFVE